MLTFVIFPLVLLLLGAAVFWQLLRNRSAEIEPPVPAVFDAERYRLLERLLGDADFAYLREQAGVPAASVRAFAERRSRIARLYLMQLQRDFDILYRSVVLIAATSAEDRSSLAAELFKCKVRFEWTLLMVRFRLRVMPLWSGRADYHRLTAPLQSITHLIHACRQTPAAAA